MNSGSTKYRTSVISELSVAELMFIFQLRRKLNSKARECIFLGYPQGSKGYRLLENSSGKILKSRDITFLEEKPLITQNKNFVDALKPGQHTIYIPCQTTDDKFLKQKADKSLSQSVTLKEVPSINNSQQPAIDKYVYDKENDNDEAELKTYQEAINDPHSEEWLNAIKELESLQTNNTWHLKPVPKNKKVIGYKWVFEVKTAPDGKTKRFKARLAAQGFSQKFGSDYDEVFAPVVRITTIRAFLCTAGKRNYFVGHVDVKTAFLHGEIKQVIIWPNHLSVKTNIIRTGDVD